MQPTGVIWPSNAIVRTDLPTVAYVRLRYSGAALEKHHDHHARNWRVLCLKQQKRASVGFNHVALEVGDVEAALAFYGRLFDFALRSKSDSMAFIDLGDQFLALQRGRTQSADDGRHFGLVVDNKT